VTYAPSRETVEALRAGLPEMPGERRQRFVSQYGIADADARILVSDPALASFYEAAVAAGADAKLAANWMTGELLRRMNVLGMRPGDVPVTPARFAALIRLITSGTISGTAAKDVFVEMWATGNEPDAIVKEKGLQQVSDESAIAKEVDAAIAADPKAVEDYRAGKTRALEALFGKVMGRMKGKANPQVVRRLLGERLG
jgi:aspartyl-tRNA(Asn)/glutamyl-tRNA(Gln) amidotransferase subunit B